MRFVGKTALVTGAASGIGRAAARAFAREGARVALLDVRSLSEVAHEISALGATCSEHRCDVTSSQEVERTFENVTRAWGGRIDVVLANAGIVKDGFIHQLGDDAWEDVLRVNLTGAFYTCRAAFPRLAPSAGSLVVTASVSALGNLGQANYAAAKAGLFGLVRTLALEGAPRGIRVNAVAPGFTDTSMMAGVPAKVRAILVEKIPLGRLARPEEIANVMLFLAGEEASYITGQVVFVDGGVSVGL